MEIILLLFNLMENYVFIKIIKMMGVLKKLVVLDRRFLLKKNLLDLILLILSIYDYFLEQDIFKTPLNEKAVSPFNLVVTNEGKLNLVDAKNTILWTQ